MVALSANGVGRPVVRRNYARRWNEAPQHLIRDRDASYGHAVASRLAAMGIRDHPTAPRSPWQSGHVERLIGSIRRECIDHIVIFGEAHLRRILVCYASYYSEARTHLSCSRILWAIGPCSSTAKSLYGQYWVDFIINTVGFSSR